MKLQSRFEALCSTFPETMLTCGRVARHFDHSVSEVNL